MGIRILIVDDADWPAVTLEIALLALPNVNVLRAGNGHEAWRLIEQQPVSAIITDLCMPGMDGFQLIERVRGTAETAAIPIVVISSDGAPETKDRVRRLRANAFFVKPCSPAAVRETLVGLLHDPI